MVSVTSQVVCFDSSLAQKVSLYPFENKELWEIVLCNFGSFLSPTLAFRSNHLYLTLSGHL